MSEVVGIVEGKALDGALYYIRGEHSFDFELSDQAPAIERIGDGGVTSLLIDTLQLEVAIRSTTALYAWGYWPYTNWQSGSVLTPNDYISGTVHLPEIAQLSDRVSVRINNEPWSTHYDEKTGWVRISENHLPAEKFVEIATNTLLGITNRRISSVLLKPIFE